MAEAKYYEYTTKNVLGKVGLSTQVFTLITKIAIEEMADVSLDMPKAALRNVAKTPIVCDFSHSRLNIQADVRIKYGKNVNKTIKALQDHIAKAISDMTDVNASTINIKVVGVEYNTFSKKTLTFPFEL